VRVEANAGPFENGRDRRPRAPREGLDAGDEFGEGKRLCEVVIGAEAETGDALSDRGGGGEHQDAGLGLGLDQSGADLIAGDDGDIAIEDEHVVVVDGRALEAGLAVIGDVDGHGVVPQPFCDRIGQLPFVFDDENPHCPPVRSNTVVYTTECWGGIRVRRRRGAGAGADRG
jgi:hypothetical protein